MQGVTPLSQMFPMGLSKQTDTEIEHRRSNIVIIDKKGGAKSST